MVVFSCAALLSTVPSCVHAPAPAPSGPGKRLQATASQVSEVRFEDEFVEARLILQALPLDSDQRPPLRAKLLRYLMTPLLPLNADRVRREATDLGSTDVFERIFEALRDGAGLYEPDELWSASLSMPADEKNLLAQAARLSLSIFAPRGAEPEAALSLAVLMTVEPQNHEWGDKFDRLLAWSDEVGASAEPGLRQSASAVELLQAVLSDWPVPAVANRLSELYTTRQKQFFSILKPPTNEGARQALRELLLAHGQEMQRTVPNVVTPYLRCGRIDRAALAAAPLRGTPGDDPELRDLLAAAQNPAAPKDSFLKLARRFLPRVELLGGTSTDNPDILVAFRVLQRGLARSPDDIDLLVLSAELAKLMSSPFLAIRQLEEAEQILERHRTLAAAATQMAQVSSDLLDLYFLRLRLSLDPERAATPAPEEVARLRQRAQAARDQHAQNTEIHVQDAQIDFELARSYMNAGLVDQAEPLFLRAQGADPAMNPDITAEFGSFMLKRGNTEQAGKILREGLAALRKSPHANDTLTGVEGQSRIERLLGDALELGGDRSGAEQAWRSSASGWDQLTTEYRRRKNVAREAEAKFEMGRTLYLLGRQSEGIQSFDEAIEQDGDRDQTYIDSIAFLVQHAEVDAALGIYHRALAKPDRSVSEYVKVYASLWILDLTRRVLKQPDVTATTFLQTLDARHPEIRPQRGSRWYRQLATFALGRISYEELLRAADTTGKKAEVYFYEAMQLLASGKAEDAHALWKKVIDTHMVSFFEFDMASRYLRGGAPANPPSLTPVNTETI